ncbi:MAG TPA: hypothetical protein RMH99_26575 [Sandaracinaceae bacterium LLY-WYZ-13_1]|nr:hypothetical protein [Sandaracinaceae bacterium LLY-WYZ-13_1]
MSLPLPADALPDKIRKFGAPDAPGPAKTMAAKGLVPVKGGDLVILLVQLSADPDEGVREAAQKTLAGVPEGVLEATAAEALPGAILDGLVDHVRRRQPVLEELVANRATPPETVARVAKWADERTCERIATDQVRLLEHPEIIESLYKNKHTRMSTVDRLVELAARNGVELEGVATFQAHVEAIQGQLIPDEPLEEPLPADEAYRDALEADGEEDAVERDKVDGSEEVKETHRPLAQKIGDMSIAQKVRLSLIGNAAARSILVRDPNKMVAMSAISSPAMNDGEAARIAVSKQVSDDILRYIGNRRDWLGNYEVKRNLLFNPKTPMGVSMKFLSHLRTNDLRALARSKSVPAALRTAAKQRMDKKMRRG